ncbi:hypothetical protein Cgig2_005818 [Carnegiea gigantea]|uniref:Cytochrome P450 n=1 Tax=Carnegiea gigantea TaxID=171969 RepID=A0A9Q1KN40_9CARY|nr:hypothetical protein Cgig2_005818 [Carnegiea gigantea]
MLLLFLLFLIAVLSLIFLTLPNLRKHEKLHLPPGPKGLPLIGNIHQFDPLTPHLYLSKLAKTYGPILSLKFGCRSAVVVQSASLAKEVMKTQDHNFCTRPPLTGMQKLSYNGLDIAFASYGEYFREIRKICVVHLLSSKKVQSSAPIRREEVSRMIQKISSLSSASEVVNLSDLLTTLSGSIICRIAFGKRFLRLLNEAQIMLATVFFADYFPFIGGWLDKLTGSSSRLERAFNDLDEFYNKIINDHLDPNKPQSDNEDIVDVLLQFRNERCFSFHLTLDHIKAVLMNIILAGTDTSVAMVVWVMTELLKNPTIMKKAQDELRTVIRDKRLIEEDDIVKLEYLKAIVKETFRLHPAAPLLIVRETLNKCTMQDYDILPKTLMFVNVWKISRDPEFWKDPEIFMPERFFESSIDFRGQDFEKENVPGMLHGLANIEMALANLLYFFDWELPVGMKKEDIDTDLIPGITMQKKNPLCLVAKKFSSSFPND